MSLQGVDQRVHAMRDSQPMALPENQEYEKFEH